MVKLEASTLAGCVGLVILFRQAGLSHRKSHIFCYCHLAKAIMVNVSISTIWGPKRQRVVQKLEGLGVLLKLECVIQRG